MNFLVFNRTGLTAVGPRPSDLKPELIGKLMRAVCAGLQCAE